MKARSRSACGDWATSSGILQVTHMTWRSMLGRDGRESAAAGLAEAPSADAQTIAASDNAAASRGLCPTITRVDGVHRPCPRRRTYTE